MVNITVTQDNIIYLVLRLTSIDLIYETEGEGYIKGSQEQKVLYGRDGVEVEAIASVGHKFTKWQVYNFDLSVWEDDETVTTTLRTDTVITQTKRVKAVFEPIDITITVETLYYKDYDNNNNPVQATMTTDVGYINFVGETEKFAPENIAEAYWKMYEEKENFETNYE